jgi:PHP family Zn ribbon phosphoesterase
MIPGEFAGSALEISRSTRPQDVLQAHPELAHYPLITNSDAHYLADIGRAYTVFDAAGPSLADLADAARRRSFRIVNLDDHG